VNSWIVQSALRPLRELRQAVDQVKTGRPQGISLTSGRSDPDIERLAAAVESMLRRLEEHALRLRALSARAISAQEEERKRIARELHDDIGQPLSLLIVQLERLASSPARRRGSGERIAEACDLATRTLGELRRVVYDLRPSMLDDLGLVPAIRWYARSALEARGLTVRYEGFEPPTRVAPQLETALYRIAQESINNIAHHAEARNVTIRLVRDGDRLCLRVEDDGRGFDVLEPAAEAVRRRRFGLLGVRERAELVGGEVRIHSAPGRGTRLEVLVPVDGSRAEVPGEGGGP
jgi:signal transduction histidine kinase